MCIGWGVCPVIRYSRSAPKEAVQLSASAVARASDDTMAGARIRPAASTGAKGLALTGDAQRLHGVA